MLQRKYPLHGIIIALDRANVSFIARVPCKLPTVSISYNLKTRKICKLASTTIYSRVYTGEKRGKNSLEISWTLVNVETSVCVESHRVALLFLLPLSFICQPWHREKKGREVRPSTSRSVKLSQYWSKRSHSRIIASLSCKPALPK